MVDKKCPDCGLWNASSALACDCGHNFENDRIINNKQTSLKIKRRENIGYFLLLGTYALSAFLIYSVQLFIIHRFSEVEPNDSLGLWWLSLYTISKILQNLLIIPISILIYMIYIKLENQYKFPKIHSEIIIGIALIINGLVANSYLLSIFFNVALCGTWVCGN